ncbi:MAG: hypothetical protein R6W72_13635 [Desulfurivibrionaceae bacterium]
MQDGNDVDNTIGISTSCQHGSCAVIGCPAGRRVVGRTDSVKKTIFTPFTALRHSAYRIEIVKTTFLAIIKKIELAKNGCCN